MPNNVLLLTRLEGQCYKITISLRIGLNFLLSLILLVILQYISILLQLSHSISQKNVGWSKQDVLWSPGIQFLYTFHFLLKDTACL